MPRWRWACSARSRRSARGVPAALGGDATRPAVMSQLAMGVLLLIYVALGVQSFIAARKAD